MEQVRVIFFFFTCILTFVPFQALAQVDTYEFDPYFNCIGQGNYTTGSTFAGNLNRLVSSLSSLTAKPYGFYNLSSGDSSGESASAIGLCRREVKRADCLSCIQSAARNLTEQCPRAKQAVVWYTRCMFRYSNMTIYGRKETSPVYDLIGGDPISSANRPEYERVRGKLLNRLKETASAGGPNRKYAQGSAFPTYFGSAHCTPDLSQQDCKDCLTIGFKDIPTCCNDVLGFRWFCPSCSFRFETGQFYDLEGDLEPDPPAIPPAAVQPADPPTVAARTEEKGKGKSGSKVDIAIVIPIVLVALFAICLCLVFKWKKNKSVLRTLLSRSNSDMNTESLLIDFETLKAATDNFSPINELGRGGFGSVYKGVLFHGQEIAVKRLSDNSGQGDIEFKNEILLLARLQHRNLVRLIGYSIQGQERLLVYEFIKNASLDHFIFDVQKRKLCGWVVRYNMIRGVAKGLLYLHEDSRYRIIHRDLKASNILLDQEMNPKIADFGLAKLFDTGQTTTHRFTDRIAGTYGYMAPEYAMHGQFSAKTDVFSFGVLVIEIITSKSNTSRRSDDDAEDLLSWVWRCWREDTIQTVYDPSLKTRSRNEMLRCIHIGLLCVQESATARPTMATVALMLSSYSFTLPTPSRPAFVSENEMVPSNVSSSRKELTMSSNDVTVSELSPR